MMIHGLKPLATMIALMIAAVSLAGCQTGRLQDERDALWVQNQELQEELDRTRFALDQSEASFREQLERARSTPAPAQEPAPTAQANSGFRDIEGVETIQGRGRVTVRVPGDVLFAPGKAELRQAARQTLSDIASVIEREYPGQTVRVEGYTDTDPIRRSNWEDNLELSAQRAMTVHRHLQERGISADRMYIAGFGETRPRGSKAQSRRVEIVVIQE
ncbi:MAG: OmpA family protein [Phycisphaeraceae bacterium]